MFEITKEDIQKLNDKDLRELVGKLCEAELRKQNIPTMYITYGGNQDASDGGIDVRVSVDDTYRNAGFIPCNFIGFQVKAQKMDASTIKNEMIPKKILRNSIKEIANKSGLYIIVSSQDDTSDTMLTSRKDVMREAVNDYPPANDLKLDFFDCQRIATWVNEHASIIQWVHMKTGTSLFGWKPFSNWSNIKGKIDDEYFIKGVKIINFGCKRRYDELSAVEGINKIRQSLSTPGVSVRIVGLSGVGKTRLVQALCDNRVGEHAINPDCIVYTELSYSPDPSPEIMAEILSARIEKAVLIIDNCAPDLHRTLASICKNGNGNVSLLTIEYDIQADIAEEVDVYKLEPSSIELIEQILQLRHNNLNQSSIRRIAEFSGGNARIALALAGELRTVDDIFTFSDDQLFKRLFWQGRDVDNELLDAAKACSLVYSFNIEENEKELDFLAQLANIPVSKFYKYIQELLRRGLIQRRGKWRAILPHSLANWLANRAFEDIPINQIRTGFEGSEELRLLRSFSKRLGFLHNNETVNNIIDQWLSDDGVLKDITSLNEEGLRIFMNIAPVNVEETLLKIEQVKLRDDSQEFFSKNNPHYQEFTDILCAIAYDTLYFKRCVKLLTNFALTENRRSAILWAKPKRIISDSFKRTFSIRDKVEGLFQMNCSGTHASAELRLAIIDGLIKKGGESAELGFDLLESALKTTIFNNCFPLDFGSRNRDEGYCPSGNEEIKAWYAYFIKFTQTLLYDDKTAEKAKELLAKRLQGLLCVGILDEINSFADIALAFGDWGTGWVSLKNAISVEGRKFSKDTLSKLEKLQEKLAPKSVYETARISLLYILNNNVENTKKKTAWLNNIAYSIANDEKTLNQLMPEILRASDPDISAFVAGLAEKCDNPERIWRMLIKEYMLQKKKLNDPYKLFSGFLQGLNIEKSEFAEKLLDEAIENDLAHIFPQIQMNVPITTKGLQRIKKSIKLGKAPKSYYSSLIDDLFYKKLNDKDLCEIVRLLATDTEGLYAGIEIYSKSIQKKTIADLSIEVIELGFKLISEYNYADLDENCVSGAVTDIIKLCVTANDPKLVDIIKMICNKLKIDIIDNKIYIYSYFCNIILESIAYSQPLIFLNTFLDFEEKMPVQIKKILLVHDDSLRPVLYAIGDEILLEWCKIKPETRYMLAASVIDPYFMYGQKSAWRPIALSIIRNVSKPCIAIDLLLNNCCNRGYSRLSSYYQIIIEMLEVLIENVNKELQAFLQKKIIENQRQYRDFIEKENPDNYGFEEKPNFKLYSNKR